MLWVDHDWWVDKALKVKCWYQNIQGIWLMQMYQNGLIILFHCSYSIAYIPDSQAVMGWDSYH